MGIYWDLRGLASDYWGLLGKWPIEIDGLPFLKFGIFHGYVSHNQMVIC